MCEYIQLSSPDELDHQSGEDAGDVESWELSVSDLYSYSYMTYQCDGEVAMSDGCMLLDC